MLLLLAFMGTTLAIELVGKFTLKSVFNYIVAVVILEKGFYLFHEGVKKLVSVTLDHGING
jgi:hypothetical protein